MDVLKSKPQSQLKLVRLNCNVKSNYIFSNKKWLRDFTVLITEFQQTLCHSRLFQVMRVLSKHEYISKLTK